MKQAPAVILIFLSAWSSLFAQTIGGSAPMDTASIRAIAERYTLPYIRDPKHVGLSIGILYAGNRYTYDYGTTDKAAQHLPTSRTIYELASITKSFTGILLAHAVIEKKLGLQDDIRRYLPGNYPHLVHQGHPITIVDLANHTAGFPKFILPLPKGATPDEVNGEYAGFSRRKFLQELKNLRPDTLPGSRYRYSNVDVELLGIILENIYQATYAELVGRYITRPNGMNDTRQEVPDADRQREAVGYDGKGQRMPDALLFRPVPGAGSLKSTTADMLYYLQLNLNEDDDAIRLSHTATFRHTDERDDDIGLCWFLHPLSDGTRLVRHAGGSFGCTSYCVVDPGLKLGIVCLTNDAGPGTESELVRLADGIMAGLNSRK